MVRGRWEFMGVQSLYFFVVYSGTRVSNKLVDGLTTRSLCSKNDERTTHWNPFNGIGKIRPLVRGGFVRVPPSYP